MSWMANAADAEEHRLGTADDVDGRSVASARSCGLVELRHCVRLRAKGCAGYSCLSTFSQVLTSTPGPGSTSSLTIVPSSITAAVALRAGAETEAGSVEGEPHRVGELAVAVRQHQDLALGALRLAPLVHDPRIVHADAGDGVDAALLELVGPAHEAREGGSSSSLA